MDPESKMFEISDNIGSNNERRKEKKKKRKRELEKEQDIDNLVGKAQDHLDSKKKKKIGKEEPVSEEELRDTEVAAVKQKEDEEESSGDKKEKKKAKFGLKVAKDLLIKESDRPSNEKSAKPLPTLNTGKGPKMIIAKESNDGVVQEDKPLSKTQQRKLKKEGQETVHEGVAQNKAIQYLDKWKNSREEWKFEKNRQTWLLNHAYDLTLLKEADFSILVEYAASIRGGMREGAKLVAASKLRKRDKSEESEGPKDTERTRAERILDALKESE